MMCPTCNDTRYVDLSRVDGIYVMVPCPACCTFPPKTVDELRAEHEGKVCTCCPVHGEHVR